MATSRTRSQYRSGILTFYDDQQNHEIIVPMAPVHWKDDFLHGSFDANATVTNHAYDIKITGAAPPTVGLAANVSNGIVRCALTADGQTQAAVLFGNDQLVWLSSNGLVGEFIFGFSTVPTNVVSAAIGVCGFASAQADDQDAIAESAWFRATGSGAIVVETDNGTTDSGAIATGTTLTAGVLMVGRIDMSVLTDVRFYINGVRVAAGTTFNMSAGTKKFQVYGSMYKLTASTGVGTLDIDQWEVWSRRS
jgi:hypothetical protein